MVIRRSVLALVVSLGLLHLAAIHALKGAPGEVALTVEADGLVSLKAHINGAGPFRLLLDTGSSAASTSRKLMRTLQLVSVGTTDLVTPSGTRARDGRLDVVSVGAASRRSLLANVLDNRDLERPPHLAQKPRPLHEKATSRPLPQSPHRKRTNPPAATGR
jgi:predicted aspartyl protease